MTIENEKNGDVWTAIHDRSEARNAMDRDSARALHDAFLEFEISDASVAVLWGKGGNFCAGWDLKLAASLANPDSCTAYFASKNMHSPMIPLPRPVLAHWVLRGWN